MPVIKINLKKLEKYLGGKVSRNEIINIIPMIGSDIESMENDYLYVEFFPNRPDLYSLEGIARALKYYFEIESPREYYVKNSDIKIFVDKSVSDIRPYIVSCLIEGVRFEDEEDLENLINFQEDLHWALGRNRKKVAIGLHDYDKIRSRKFYYLASKDEKFVPLNENREYSLEEILERLETGKKYGYILSGYNKYPIIKDENGRIISFPPIINADFTKIDLNTRKIFVEMTGTDKFLLYKALNILALSFYERGCEINTVEIIYDGNIERTPRFEFEEYELRTDYVRKILGLNLMPNEIAKSLKRMGYIIKEVHDDKLKVLIPPYRVDIFHEIDLVEDVAIGYGYDKISGTIPKVFSIGKPDKFEEFSNKIRSILIGLGFNEVVTLTLTSKEFEHECFIEEDAIEIKNPIGVEYKNLRTSLIPSLLKFIYINRYKELPIKIFEIGNVFKVINGRVSEERNLCAMIYDTKTDVNDILQVLVAIEKYFGIKFSFESIQKELCLRNRCYRIILDGEQLGIMGEISPIVLIRNKLSNPISFLEINLDKILKLI